MTYDPIPVQNVARSEALLRRLVVLCKLTVRGDVVFLTDDEPRHLDISLAPFFWLVSCSRGKAHAQIAEIDKGG
jgi:hypothetical protein